MRSTVGDLMRTLSDSGYHSDIPLVWSAYELAEDAHHGQRRVSGDRYISHPVEVATIVAGHGWRPGSGAAQSVPTRHDYRSM